jgi:hypothetical protein
MMHINAPISSKMILKESCISEAFAGILLTIVKNPKQQ